MRSPIISMILRYRALFTIFLLSIVLWVFKYAFINSSYDLQKRYLETALSSTVTTVEKSILLWKKERIRSARKWADSPFILKQFEASGSVNSDETRNWLKSIAKLSNFQYAILTDSKLTPISNSGTIIDDVDFENSLDSRVTSALELGASAFSNLIMVEGTSKAVLPLWTAIFDDEANILGFLILISGVEELHKLLEVGKLGLTGRTYILNKSGNFAFLSADSNPVSISAINSTENPELGSNGMAIDVDGYLSIDGTKVIGHTKKITDIGLTIVVEQEYWEAYESIDKQANIGNIFVLASNIILLIVSWSQDNSRIKNDYEQTKFRSLFFDSGKMYMTLNPEGEIVDSNDYLIKTFLPDKEGEVPRSVFQVLHLIEKSIVLGYLERAKAKQSVKFEYTQNDCHYNISIRHIKLSKYNFKKNLLFFEADDITIQSNLQNKIYLNEERLRVALNSTHQGLFEMDFENNSEYFDPSILNMLGYEDNKVINRSTLDSLCYPQDLAKLANHYLKLQLSKGVDDFYLESRFRSHSNSWRVLAINAKIIKRKEDGTPARVVGIHSDITKRKALEAKILKKTE